MSNVASSEALTHKIPSQRPVSFTVWAVAGLQAVVCSHIQHTRGSSSTSMTSFQGGRQWLVKK